MLIYAKHGWAAQNPDACILKYEVGEQNANGRNGAKAVLQGLY
jgi:hypothetical protein